MNTILDLIIEELENPFKDPRFLRTPNLPSIPSDQLLYCLKDENPKSFKIGIIVAATVVRILDIEGK